MSTVTLHPFGSGPLRDRTLTSAPAPTPASLWQRVAARYWAGWEHYARAYSAEVDQHAVLPLPTAATRAAEPSRALGGNRWISIR